MRFADLIKTCEIAGYKPDDWWLTYDENYTVLSMLRDNPGLIEVMDEWVREHFPDDFEDED